MAAPKITATVVDVNEETKELTGDEEILIKYHSNAKARMTVTPQDGEVDMSTCRIQNGDEIVYGTSHTFDGVYKKVFHFSAKDENGNIGSTSLTPEMIDYVKLTCTITNSKPDANGNTTLSCTGSYFNGDFGAYENELILKYSYDCSDGTSDWGYIEEENISFTGNTYSASVELEGLDYEQTYTFEITAKDKLETVASSERGVTSLPLFHWGKGDFTFEVPVTVNGIKKSKYSESMQIRGNLRLKGSKSSYGNILYFGDTDCCYITEKKEDGLTIRSSGIVLDSKNSETEELEKVAINASEISLNGNSLCGYWIPRFSNYKAVAEYRTQEGWYQRLGNVITIGWHLKATIKTNKSENELKIVCDEDYFALPEPSVSAFGGGVAYNIRTEDDYIFEGWSIAYDDDDESDTYEMTVIAARLQRCEKASTGELQIGSTCYYPDVSENATVEEKTVTVAGTICYMTEE